MNPGPPQLQISRRRWRQVTTELHRRGQDQRESGAFLLTSAAPADITIRAVAYYDDLDANCLTGGITLAGSAYSTLWKQCRSQGLRVLADIHTHPGDWTGQSSIDAANPMIGNAGHLALILPRFAVPPVRTDSVGIHLHTGAKSWQHLLSRRTLRLTLFDRPHPASKAGQALARAINTFTGGRRPSTSTSTTPITRSTAGDRR